MSVHVCRCIYLKIYMYIKRERKNDFFQGLGSHDHGGLASLNSVGQPNGLEAWAGVDAAVLGQGDITNIL